MKRFYIFAGLVALVLAVLILPNWSRAQSDATFGTSASTATPATTVTATPDIQLHQEGQSDQLNQVGEETLPVVKEQATGFSFWTFVGDAVDYAVKQGVPKNTLVLLLMLPIIATIIVITRQLIGIDTLGIYIPSIVTIAFLAMGIKAGLIMFIAIILTGGLMRYWLRKVRILYLPRMATLLIAVALVVFALIIVSAALGFEDIAKTSIFPIIIMIILVERFIDVQIERGSGEAIKLTVETIIISCVCYVLMSWRSFQNFIFLHPGYILFLIPVNLLIGRWTGLRLVEYFRFKKIMEKNDKS